MQERADAIDFDVDDVREVVVGFEHASPPRLGEGATESETKGGQFRI